eukprot:TRINITY_DN17867_c0_g1_i1.p1 TRINITY_DN17867_c0_g1~~TRINITY_DN17867_c0_g1_i1.p1  ORF type:complete len:354 (+),score=72.92 TRINITY_DN17867_c0_g1_i1:23-1084(+)
MSFRLSKIISQVTTMPSAEMPPLRITITGACGQIAYSLAFLIARGVVFGSRPVILQLFDLPQAEKALRGMAMELMDASFPTLKQVILAKDAKEAFSGANICILLGSSPRRPGMERKDLIAKNAAIFTEQGKAISDYADRDVKVLVVGNPANTNALILIKSAPSIPPRNITCLTRLDHNRCKAQVAEKAQVNVANVHNVIIWGNHSSTQYPDVSHGYINDFLGQGTKTPITVAIPDAEWYKTLVTTVQLRGAQVLEARKASSAASAATAICDHLRDWIMGTQQGEYVSMGVLSDGSCYGVSEGVVFSFPCVCCGGRIAIVDTLDISTDTRVGMDRSLRELIEEKNDAFTLLGLK